MNFVSYLPRLPPLIQRTATQMFRKERDNPPVGTPPPFKPTGFSGRPDGLPDYTPGNRDSASRSRRSQAIVDGSWVFPAGPDDPELYKRHQPSPLSLSGSGRGTTGGTPQQISRFTRGQETNTSIDLVAMSDEMANPSLGHRESTADSWSHREGRGETRNYSATVSNKRRTPRDGRTSPEEREDGRTKRFYRELPLQKATCGGSNLPRVPGSAPRPIHPAGSYVSPVIPAETPTSRQDGGYYLGSRFSPVTPLTSEEYDSLGHYSIGRRARKIYQMHAFTDTS